MKLTRKELNTLIESFLFEREETEEAAEKELPEIIIRIIKKNGTDSGISIVLRKLGQRIQAFIKKSFFLVFVITYTCKQKHYRCYLYSISIIITQANYPYYY